MEKAYAIGDIHEMTGDKIIGYVFETEDHSKFKKMNGNRKVSKNTVHKIMESINEIGRRLVPVLVNEDFEIADGQHREEANKELSLPTIYIMEEGITPKECAYLNQNQTNWKEIDWIEYYVSQGNDNYIRFKDVITDTSIGLAIVYGLSKRIIIGGGLTKLFKGGCLTFTSEDEFVFYSVKELAELIDKKLNTTTSGQSRRLYITSICWAYGISGVNKNRLFNVIEEQFDRFESYASVEAVLKKLSELYNRNLAKSDRFAFHAIYADENK